MGRGFFFLYIQKSSIYSTIFIGIHDSIYVNIEFNVF